MNIFPITVTESASNKAQKLLSQSDQDNLRLRIQVSNGGCSGLIYQLYFDERYLEDDIVENFGELEVIIDNMSVPYLDGAIVDYNDTLEKQGFEITNPNAAGSCACGDSFH